MTRAAYYLPPTSYKAPPLAQYLPPAKPTSGIYRYLAGQNSARAVGGLPTLAWGNKSAAYAQSNHPTRSQYLLCSNLRHLQAALLGAKKLELPLVWDKELEKYARWWADQRSADYALQHSFPDGGFELGNAYFGMVARNGPLLMLWADKEKYYDYDSNTCAEGQMRGHYTQIVWSTIRKLGCARVLCQDGDVFMTCNYYPLAML
ncbi:LOW QUALITY PROTEIN: hypothetical protein Cgig2_033778 [Carnegiea gigantea]|uniref:SCP domain-containing protein n=1 Tax=Carnegiea gigantea TaxID=171969 RepID=A0A9Q1KFP0_9CARY|nr:LOW QUALITY PROTEIN: hypothetical protein Cgig2_033778 [Carnegiea gigantea]